MNHQWGGVSERLNRRHPHIHRIASSIRVKVSILCPFFQVYFPFFHPCSCPRPTLLPPPSTNSNPGGHIVAGAPPPSPLRTVLALIVIAGRNSAFSSLVIYPTTGIIHIYTICMIHTDDYISCRIKKRLPGSLPSSDPLSVLFRLVLLLLSLPRRSSIGRASTDVPDSRLHSRAPGPWLGCGPMNWTSMHTVLEDPTPPGLLLAPLTPPVVVVVVVEELSASLLTAVYLSRKDESTEASLIFEPVGQAGVGGGGGGRGRGGGVLICCLPSVV